MVRLLIDRKQQNFRKLAGIHHHDSLVSKPCLLNLLKPKFDEESFNLFEYLIYIFFRL